jgi:hypothetical protein
MNNNNPSIESYYKPQTNSQNINQAYTPNLPQQQQPIPSNLPQQPNPSNAPLGQSPAMPNSQNDTSRSIYSTVEGELKKWNDKAKTWDKSHGVSDKMQAQLDRVKDNENVRTAYGKMEQAGEKVQSQINKIKKKESVKNVYNKVSDTVNSIDRKISGDPNNKNLSPKSSKIEPNVAPTNPISGTGLNVPKANVDVVGNQQNVPNAYPASHEPNIPTIPPTNDQRNMNVRQA